jgi:hypothetical protein
LQIGVVLWIASELKTVGDQTESLSSYIISNKASLLVGNSPTCSLDYAFSSEAQPPLVRKSQFTPILFKVILLASSTVFCAVGMFILSKNPFKP